jgi:hypothetical protein
MKPLSQTVSVLILACLLYAQRTMTVAQLTGFIKSSVAEKLDDRQVAEVLKKTKLTEKLEDRVVEQLQGLGAGRQTVAALRDLARESASLPAPAPVAPKPAPRVYATPDSVDQARIIEAVREYALNYSQNLPNFICTQVTRQQVDPTGTGDHWRSENKFQEQLTYFDHHEQYRVVMVNGQLVNNRDHSKLEGAISEGEFGSMLYEIFARETNAEFQYERPGKWDGRLMHVLDYRVVQPRSHYQIEERTSGRKIIAGYHGRIWANQETNAVMRLTLECEEIPADFPIKDVSLDMQYDVIKISDQEFVLPLKWDLKSREGQYLAWNTAELTLYRKYSADATISFEEAEPLPDKTKEEAPKPPVKKNQ